MTSEDIRSEVEHIPFIPFRLHLVSGAKIDVTIMSTVWMLQNAVLILDPPTDAQDEGNYNIIALRNIERLERLKLEKKNEQKEV